MMSEYGVQSGAYKKYFGNGKSLNVVADIQSDEISVLDVTQIDSYGTVGYANRDFEYRRNKIHNARKLSTNVPVVVLWNELDHLEGEFAQILNVFLVSKEFYKRDGDKPSEVGTLDQNDVRVAIFDCMADVARVKPCELYEFNPSEELIDIVRNSVIRKRSERDTLSEYTSLAATLSNSKNDQKNEVAINAMDKDRQSINDTFLADIKRHISEGVTEFLATLGRGAAIKSSEPFPLTANKTFLESVLKGFVFRIPVSYVFFKEFDQFLFRDLRDHARKNLLCGPYSKVIVSSEGELLLLPTKSIPEPKQSDWERAEVFIPS